jgi:ribosomal protein S18 acetylase RimI-like enzyme
VLEAVRLAALADSPSAFGSSLAVEADHPADFWEARAVVGAAGERSVTFFADLAGSVVGLVGAHRQDAEERSVELVSMWVSPTQRRSGIAADLVDAVVSWARETGATTVELWVTRGNDAAVRLYEAAGFRSTGDHQPLPSDPCKDELRMRRNVG